MENLIALYHKLLDAEAKLSAAYESDWPASRRAYKAAATRARKAYNKAIDRHLGSQPYGNGRVFRAQWSLQDKIDLMHKVQKAAA
jgi:hypothetical protein